MERKNGVGNRREHRLEKRGKRESIKMKKSKGVKTESIHTVFEWKAELLQVRGADIPKH